MQRTPDLISALALFTSGAERTVGNVKVVDTTLRWVNLEPKKVQFRAKIHLDNTAPKSLKVWGFLVLFDEEDFEIWRYPFFATAIAAQTTIAGVSGYVVSSAGEKISSWGAHIEEEYVI